MEALSSQFYEKEKLLLIDDDPGDLAFCGHNILKSRLSSRFDVITADSCEQALDLFKSTDFTCCLVDYNLPVDSGMDFLKSVRRLDNGLGVAIIIMTGVGDEGLAVDAMRNGAQDYLIKDDLTPENLGDRIINAIHSSELESKLRQLAHYDNLTGLLNRSLFMDRIKTAIDQCDRYNQSCSLLYIDVDNFKQINDQYGHEAGDALLKEVGRRLKANCRTTDSPSRLGGDEFAVLLAYIDAKDAQLTATKILEQVSQPIYLESHSLQVSLSIGIAHYPNTASDLKALMSQADEAMYKAKKTGKAKYYQFTQEQRELWERRNCLETLLPKAIEKNELTLAYQPIVDVIDHSLHSLEVLARWSPFEEEVDASELIAMVERLGLFDAYHQWLFDTALAQLKQWQQYCPDLQLSLNVPANRCHSPLLVNTIKQSLLAYEINPEHIELEITETTLMKHPALSSQLLAAMQKEGIKVAIDDFGTGYSSMAYLTTLPINTLKIDQRFFIDMENDMRNRKVVEAVSALGRSLGLKVIAEGVERYTQYQMASEVGCDYVQGFYCSKPVPAKKSWNDFVAQFSDSFVGVTQRGLCGHGKQYCLFS